MLGKKTKREFNVPDIAYYVNYMPYETLFVFGSPIDHNDRRLCLGVGTITKIEKGNEFDIIRINFGRRYARKIIVTHNHARRQLLTLKRGQLAWFYGYFKVYANGKNKQTIFFARGLQGWYVPKAVDIKALDNDNVESLDLDNENDLTNFLDEILKGE